MKRIPGGLAYLRAHPVFPEVPCILCALGPVVFLFWSGLLALRPLLAMRVFRNVLLVFYCYYAQGNAAQICKICANSRKFVYCLFFLYPFCSSFVASHEIFAFRL